MIRGYVTSRSFAGLDIPVPAQNATLREYAKSVSQPFSLPPLEHKFDNCYMQLFTLLSSANFLDTIAMYSVSMLPLNDLSKLSTIRSIALDKNLSFYFVLEGASSADLFQLSTIMQSYSLRAFFDNSSTPSLDRIRSSCPLRFL